MGESLPVPAAAAHVALVPVPSLGVVLAGCPACRRPVGLDGAPGLGEVLAEHRRGCPRRPRSRRPVCPGCGCEAELWRRGNAWRCSDCWAWLLLGESAGGAA